MSETPHNQLSSSMLFALRSVAIGNRIMEKVIEKFAGVDMPPAALESVRAGCWLKFKEGYRRISGSVIGSDAIELLEQSPTHSMMLKFPDQHDFRQTLGRTLALKLFKDGSPWVSEYDVERGAANTYRIITTPDSPPTIVNQYYVDAIDNHLFREAGAPHTANLGDVHIFGLVQVEFGAEAVSQLPDADCDAVVLALNASFPSVDYVATAAAGQLGEFDADNNFLQHLSRQERIALRDRVYALNTSENSS